MKKQQSGARKRPAKASRTVFVIMPFRATPTRKRDDLTAFFDNNLKRCIEQCDDLPFRHIVKRSDDTFNITEQIIRDLYEADIVICDLSGHDANPNVMYELGVRLSVSSKPVILIREQHPKNRMIFDIGGFYAFEYNPHQYASLEAHLIDKIRRLEAGLDQYTSPVLKVLEIAPQVVQQMATLRVDARLQATASGLHSLYAAALRALFAFTAEQGLQISNPQNINALSATEVYALVFGRRDELAALDWHLFKFKPLAPPPLVAYLEEPVLQFLLPPPVPQAFNAMLDGYYAEYFASDYLWTHATAKATVDFLGYTLMTWTATQLIVGMFKTAGDETRYKAALETFSLYVRDTPFMTKEHKELFEQISHVQLSSKGS